MRMKPLLAIAAIAALAVAIAGCAPPQSQVPSVTQTTPKGFDPRVTLDVQGVGKAEVKASRITHGPEQVFVIALPKLFAGNGVATTVFFMPKGSPHPAGASQGNDWYKANGDPATSYTWTTSDDDEATHRLNTVETWAYNRSWFQARFEGEGYAADGVIASSYDEFITITHPLGDAKGWNLKPRLTFSPAAPAGLAMVSWDNQGDLIPHAALAMAHMAEDKYKIINSYQLELDFSVTSQDDMPLDGLTKDHFKLRSLETTPYHEGTARPTFELEARGKGQYTVRVGFRHAFRPETVSVDLALRDIPFVHDVEY
jgi:hypothetical protein